MAKSDDFESIDIRKIENGYVMRRSGSDSKGGYKSSETYHENKPEVVVAKPAKPSATKPKSSLQRAAAHLRRS